MTAVAAAGTRSRFGLEGLQESRVARALFGVLLLAAIVGIVYLILLLFTGQFTNVVAVESSLPPGSNAVPVGAAVEYRNVTVGKVATETPTPNGGVNVKLDFYPSHLSAIPLGVETEVAPLSIFGNQYVELVAPKTITAEHIQAGDFIHPYTGAASTSLQGTVTQLYTLLHAIKPAYLDEALTAFATALNGEGTTLNQFLASASNYGSVIEPRLGTIESDLRLVPPVSGELQASAPSVSGTLANSAVIGQTISSEAAALRSLLGQGAASVTQLDKLLTQVQAAVPSLANESAPLLSDVTRNPNELALTLEGLGEWSAAWANAETQGPYISVNASLKVASSNGAVNASLGYDNPASISQALGAAFNPATYSAANCPEYPGESNPYCGSGGSPDANPASTTNPYKPLASSTLAGSQDTAAQADAAELAAGPELAAGTGSASPVMDPQLAAEEDAAYDIATALGGGTPPASASVAEIVLIPFLTGLSGSGSSGPG